MERTQYILLICCATSIVSGHSHSHTIPIENYETKLHVLDQHVEIPEPPVKLIKITKTVAVKIPVPYPVKVVEKVPYPVHVAKPYPVPVTQIVHVPQPAHVATMPHYPHHEENSHGRSSGGLYQVQDHGGDSFSPPTEHSFDGNSHFSPDFGISDEGHSFEGGQLRAPTGSHSYSGDNNDSGSKTYDDAFKQYFHKHNINGNESPNNFYYR